MLPSALPLTHAMSTTTYIAEHEETPRVEKVVLIREDIDWTMERIEKEIEYRANLYEVSAEVMKTVVRCESQFHPKAVGDGGKSRGLVQIHSGYHPHVTDDMAYDPKYALDFLAQKLAEGQGHLWTCYRMYYG